MSCIARLVFFFDLKRMVDVGPYYLGVGTYSVCCEAFSCGDHSAGHNVPTTAGRFAQNVRTVPFDSYCALEVVRNNRQLNRFDFQFVYQTTLF